MLSFRRPYTVVADEVLGCARARYQEYTRQILAKGQYCQRGVVERGG